MDENPKNNPIFSVSDFLAIINQTLEYTYSTVEIEGEVSSFKINQEKFVFFDLKDDEGKVSCFMTVWQLRMPIEDGMKVVVSAAPKITKWGSFSLTVKSIRPSGEGSLKKSFELLKNKLEKEGLFDSERKRSLPVIPQHIAVIASVQSAGYADFIKILNERWGGILVDVAHVQVQGEGSADQIINAIKYINQLKLLPEVLVIIRGGGSADDLSTFNDELLARAIASSRVPTLVGVGHEIDESLADLVADKRASTPSNAAQIVVPDKKDIIRRTHLLVNSLLPRIDQSLDIYQQTIERQLQNAILNIDQSLDVKADRLANLQLLISQLNPQKVLARGYAIVRGKLQKGAEIEIDTDKNIIKAEVKNVTKK